MSEQPGKHTYAEIMSQPETWAKALNLFADKEEVLKSFWHAGNFERVIFTGCGSAYYVAMVGARLFQSLTGALTQAIPASELVLFPETIYTKHRTLLVTVSRSGTTTETAEAVEVFRERVQGSVLYIGCTEGSALEKLADFALVADFAREESVAQTRSFSTMVVLAQLTAAAIGGLDSGPALQTLPATCQRLLETYRDLARRLGEDADIERFFFLGSHILYGIANEAMLKMKEMSLSYSEAYHTLEFRHGPMSMVDSHTLIVGLASANAYTPEMAVLREMHSRGARVLALAESFIDDSSSFYNVALDSNIPDWARTILYLPILQLVAYYRALSRGQNPDRPAGLEYAIMLDKVR